MMVDVGLWLLSFAASFRVTWSLSQVTRGEDTWSNFAAWLVLALLAIALRVTVRG